jgi:hypothetical protein
MAPTDVQYTMKDIYYRMTGVYTDITVKYRGMGLETGDWALI